MSAPSEVSLNRSPNSLTWLDSNEANWEQQVANMSDEEAEALFNAFDQMVTGADKLDGDVIFKGRKLSRVNYGGDFMRLFGSDRAYVATEGESKKARTVFKTALLKYIDARIGPGRRDELRNLVNTIFSEGQARKPLSRRTISQAVNIVKDARAGNGGEAGSAKNAMIGRALGGQWKKGVQWKLIGGSLGVKMTREHLQTMLSNAMSVAKTRVNDLSKAGASALADGLKAQMDRYLKLFDANKLGGALERLVINGLDKESVADEMLRQLEKDSIPQMLGKDVRRDGTLSLGVVSETMRNKLIALKNAEDTIGSKAILDRIQIAGGGEALSAEQRQRNLLGDLLLNANTMDAVYYMNDGERLLVRLTEDTELFSSMCKAAVGKNDGKGGQAMLDALGKVSADLKQKFTALFAAVGKLVNPKDNADQSPLEFKSMLFAKLDLVYKAFQASKIEEKITAALKDRAGAVADQVVGQIKSVCTGKVNLTDLEIVKELITKADDIGLRRMFAASFREGQGAVSGDFSPAAFIRGMGVYANKLLQGLPLRPETEIGKENQQLTAMYSAVSRARNDLPKIDTSILEAELYATLSAENNQIQSVAVNSWIGAGSVAQTGLCKVIYKQQDGQNLVNDGGVDVVLKALRPDIKEVFKHEAKIVRDLITSRKNDVNLLGQHHKRVTSFNEECITKKELINALRGIKQFGVPYARRGDDDPMRQLKMPWKINGTTIEFSEKNLVGSENLVLKADKTMADLWTSLNKLDETAPDAEYGNLIDEFFLGATDTFFVIERAPGQDLAKFNATFKAEVTDNNCGLGNPANDERPVADKIEIVKQNRDTIQTLNRALTQLKSTFLKNALHTKGHFFHCDLTAGNVVFDKKTGSLTIIDYGKTGKLSDDEALAMLKLENLELHIKDGVQNGKKMREAYQSLLNSEISRLDAKISGFAQKPYDADEHTLDLQTLTQLNDTLAKLTDVTTAVNLDYLFQKAFVRIDEKARTEVPPQVKTSFELFADVLKDVSASISDLDLPLPSVVRDFIDTYSRLQNGINDAQNNLNALNAKISDLIAEQQGKENARSLHALSREKLECFGWLDTEVSADKGATTVTLKAGEIRSSTLNLNFGKDSFSERLYKLSTDLYSKKFSLEERQSKLNAIKVLLENERARLQKTVDILQGVDGDVDKNMAAELRKTLGLGENAQIKFVHGDSRNENSLKSAITRLEEIEKSIKKEIDLVSTSFASDSMFSTSPLGENMPLATENRMLAAGHFNTADTNIRRTSVTLTDMTAFRAAKAQKNIQNDEDAKKSELPPNLRQRFRELLLTSGYCDWKQAMVFLANDQKCTFFEYENLLETCTARMDELKGKVDFSVGVAYDPEVKPDLSPLTMKITDTGDKEFFDKLFGKYESKGAKPKGNGDVKDILTSFEQLREKIIPSIKNIDLTQFEDVVLRPREYDGPEEIFGTNLEKLYRSNANDGFQLAVTTTTHASDPISLAIAKNYGNELTVTALAGNASPTHPQPDIIDNPMQVEELKGDKAYKPYMFNNNIDVKSIRNAIGLAVIAFPQIKEDFDLRYKILKNHLVNENLDPVLKQKYQAFVKEIDGVYQNDNAYDPTTGTFHNEHERPTSPRRLVVSGGKWEYEGGEMLPDSNELKPEVVLDKYYGSVLRNHVTLLDYYRITALISEAKTDELELDEAGVETYEMLRAQLEKLPGGQGSVKDVKGATFGDLGELMDRVKAGFALKYNPLGATDFGSYKEFYKSTHDGQEFTGSYVSEHQCKQELNDYVTKNMGNVLEGNQYEVIDYGEGVIDGVQVKDDYIALVKGATRLNIPGYGESELRENGDLDYYSKHEKESVNYIPTLKNKEYIKVAGDVERALKKQPRLNDNQALVNADLDNNADFDFGKGVKYKKFDQNDVLYMSFDPVKPDDVDNKPLQEEDGNTVIFFETGLKEGKKAGYANNKLKVVQMNDLKLSRHLYDQKVKLTEDGKTSLENLNGVYENDVVGKEGAVLLGYIDRAVGMLFERDADGNFVRKGSYFDSVREFLGAKVDYLSNAVKAVEESNRKINAFRKDNVGKDYTNDKQYKDLLKSYNDSNGWIKTHCKSALGKTKGGIGDLLRYLRDPGAVVNDRNQKKKEGEDFTEPNLSLLPVLQELVLKLDVQNLPPENVEQQGLAANSSLQVQ